MKIYFVTSPGFDFQTSSLKEAEAEAKKHFKKHNCVTWVCEVKKEIIPSMKKVKK